MTTFVLKKYEEIVNDETKSKEEIEKEEPKEISIQVEGSVSEIVANALQNVLGKKLHIEEITDEVETETNVKAISTEDINKDPALTFNSIKKDDIVFINTKGFVTAKEEWFLMNISNKTDKVFFSVESLIKHLRTALGV